MTLALIVLALAFGLAFLPQMWIRGVIARHSSERPDLAGTGGEFARHVLDGMGLHHVVVEETQHGDHYDPDAKAVRLLPQHFGKRSLAAVVIAAHHDVGRQAADAVDDRPGFSAVAHEIPEHEQPVVLLRRAVAQHRGQGGQVAVDVADDEVAHAVVR